MNDRRSAPYVGGENGPMSGDQSDFVGVEVCLLELLNKRRPGAAQRCLRRGRTRCYCPSEEHRPRRHQSGEAAIHQHRCTHTYTMSQVRLPRGQGRRRLRARGGLKSMHVRLDGRTENLWRERRLLGAVLTRRSPRERRSQATPLRSPATPAIPSQKSQWADRQDHA